MIKSILGPRTVLKACLQRDYTTVPLPQMAAAPNPNRIPRPKRHFPLRTCHQICSKLGSALSRKSCRGGWHQRWDHISCQQPPTKVQVIHQWLLPFTIYHNRFFNCYYTCFFACSILNWSCSPAYFVFTANWAASTTSGALGSALLHPPIWAATTRDGMRTSMSLRNIVCDWMSLLLKCE